MYRDLKLKVAGSVPGSGIRDEFLLYRKYAFGTTNCSSILINYLITVTAARTVVQRSQTSFAVGSSPAGGI